MMERKEIKCGPDSGISIKVTYQAPDPEHSYLSRCIVFQAEKNGYFSLELTEMLEDILRQDERQGVGFKTVIAMDDLTLVDKLRMPIREKDRPIIIEGNPGVTLPVTFPELFRNTVEDYLESVGRRLVEKSTGRHPNDIDIEPAERAEHFASSFLRETSLEGHISLVGVSLFMRNQLNHTDDTEELRRGRVKTFLSDRGIENDEAAISQLVSATGKFIDAERTMGEGRGRA